MAKQENPLADVIGMAQHAWRHRKGIAVAGRKIESIKIGKYVLHIEHHIPGLIQDTFHNLRYETKDGRKPVLVAKRRTDYGWHLVFNLPPGISFSKIRRQREYFQDATNAWIEMRWDGKLHMDVYAGTLPTSLRYEWKEHKGELPVPVGVSQRGIEVFDLSESPHLLVAGVPGFGKSNFLHVLIHSLLPRAYIAVIDLKRLEFAYLKHHALVTRSEGDALQLMELLNQEMEKRIDTLEAAGCVKVQEYDGEMPYIVLVIDEVAEIQDDKVIYYIDRIVRLARAVGISVVAATQRPSKKVKLFADDTRDMFAARLCYQMADEISSRIVLGENGPMAAHLPGIKGRGIFKFGMSEREVQTHYLPITQAKKHLKEIEAKRWTVDAKPTRKRLRPR